MRNKLRKILKASLNRVLDTTLSSEARIKLGRYILNRELGEGIGDPTQNGETALIRRVKGILRGRSATVLDVGAHFGAWTGELADGMTSDLRIFAFEPIPAIFEKLSANVRSCTATVLPVRGALSDTDGAAEIYLAEGLAETNSLARRPGVTESGVLAVQRSRGDSFCRDRGIDTVDVIKIDVEGHELAVLRGFEAMLKEQRVGCIQFEYGSTWIDSRTFLADAFELLRSNGYQVGKIVPSGVRPVPRYESALDGFRFANFLAARPDWALRLLSGA